jgi:peptidoglycan/xylan/chitin deacetylase (PgdA/CDA1 family)
MFLSSRSSRERRPVTVKKEVRMGRKFLIVLMTQIMSLWITGSQPRNIGEPQPQPKEIAITIDDLPLNGPQFEVQRLEAMTGKILAAIKQHRVPAVGFVNESLLYLPGQTDARIAILKAWSDAGVELGNHTFSHLTFKQASLAEYQDDFIRGDAVIRMLMRQRGQKPRYFRHPFLHMGATPDIERSFENFIAERGYRAAPVTIDILDWMILSAYNGARKQGDAELLRRVSDEYLKFAARKFDFCEQVAAELFGRPIKHILLLHANELSGDNLEGLFKMLEERGYRFITLEEALKDPFYQFPDRYQATSDWLLHWSASKGKKFDPPMPPDFTQKP